MERRPRSYGRLCNYERRAPRRQEVRSILPPNPIVHPVDEDLRINSLAVYQDFPPMRAASEQLYQFLNAVERKVVASPTESFWGMGVTFYSDTKPVPLRIASQFESTLTAFKISHLDILFFDHSIKIITSDAEKKLRPPTDEELEHIQRALPQLVAVSTRMKIEPLPPASNINE